MLKGLRWEGAPTRASSATLCVGASDGEKGKGKPGGWQEGGLTFCYGRISAEQLWLRASR